MEEAMNFGEHLMIDGYGGAFEALNDRNRVHTCLEDLVKKCEMNKLSDAHVFYAKGNNNKDSGGWSGYIIIQESHISIHTFPRRGFLSADVYTCKNGMDRDLIISFLKEVFELKETEVHFVKRGTLYPKRDIYIT